MASQQSAFHSALESNKKWCSETAASKPDLFPALARGQSPQILWIGCSDSRVPETTLLGLQPGEVFVHRNIANVLHPGDLSSQSVIAYAVGALKVKHVVLCGHTSCGGCAAALGNGKLGILDAWLLPLRKLRADNLKKWEGLDEKERALKLVEANVRAGVQTLRENSTVIEALDAGGLEVHGVVYDVGSGELRELDVGEPEEERKVRELAFRTK